MLLKVLERKMGVEEWKRKLWSLQGVEKFGDKALGKPYV